MKKIKLNGLQIVSQEANTIAGWEKDVTYVKNLKEINVDYVGGNIIITADEFNKMVTELINWNK